MQATETEATVHPGVASDDARPPRGRTFRIEMTGPDAHSDLRSLETALLRFPQVRQYAAVSVVGPPPERDTIGSSVVDTIQLVADISFQTASLVVAIMQWRAAVRSTSAVTVEPDNLPPVVIPEGGVPDQATAEEIAREIDGHE